MDSLVVRKAQKWDIITTQTSIVTLSQYTITLSGSSLASLVFLTTFPLRFAIGALTRNQALSIIAETGAQVPHGDIKRLCDFLRIKEEHF